MSKIEQEEKYPVALVIMTYGLFNGVLGILIYTLYFLVKYDYVVNFLTITGLFYGFIPAVCVGIWLAVIKFTVTKKSDYFKVAMIGYFSHLFYFFIVYAIKGNYMGFNFIFPPILYVCPLSAMTIGWFVLPKQRESSEKEMIEIKQQEKYPVALVIFMYGLLGGAVGGGIVTLPLIASAFFEGTSSAISGGLVFFPIAMFMGAMLGFIPSIFAGIWLALIKFTVTKKTDYLKIAMIGYFSTVFYLGVYATIIIKMGLSIISIVDVFELFGFNHGSGTLYAGLVGAFSAMILGWFVLPKKNS